MSKLPKHLHEVQNLFRARMDEQNRRIDALFEDNGGLVPSDRILAEMRSSKIVETTTAEVFLEQLRAEIPQGDADAMHQLNRIVQ